MKVKPLEPDQKDLNCPNCRRAACVTIKRYDLGRIGKEDVMLGVFKCPSCEKPVLLMVHGRAVRGPNDEMLDTWNDKCLELLWPKQGTRPPAPSEVPEDFAEDYNEACRVLTLSPKASAALGRRCLQHVLREKAGVKRINLEKEIDEAIGKGLPSHIADSLHIVRHLGNFAAHPIKSQNTGEVIPVEPGEAESTLDALESLFDFYFVEPAKAKARKDALNKKLTEAGKPPLK